MARRTIYVPEDVDEEVERFKDRINVSEVCVKALRGEVSRLKMMEGSSPVAIDLDTLAERLRTQRRNSLKRSIEGGKAAAVRWLNAAGYDEIEHYARDTEERFDDKGFIATEEVGLPYFEESERGDFMSRLSAEGLRAETDAYTKAWKQQVKQVWDAIKDRI